MKITWSPLAIQRVIEQADVITHDKPNSAVRWTEGTFAAVDRLERHPMSGRVVPEVGRPEVREVIHGGYRIIYRVGTDQIFILTVRSSWRLLDPTELTAPSSE